MVKVFNFTCFCCLCFYLYVSKDESIFFLLHSIPDGVLQADMVALALHLRVSIVT
jgi:hypothetical protein